MRLFFSIIVCFVSCHAYAQSLQQIEAELLVPFRQIQYWSVYKEPDQLMNRHDSIVQANNTFRNRLLQYTSGVRATFTYDFAALEKEGLVIRTSEDGLFRIYSWDSWMGGTAHQFEAIFQYKAANKVFSKLAVYEDGDMGRWYSNIYDLKVDHKTYYIGLYHEIYSSKDSYQGVKLFCIEENKLNEAVRLFKTTTGIRNQLGFEYNFFSVADHPERPVKLIYYDKDEDQLHLAVVLEDGKVTKRFITYQFTGKYFERVKGR
jgi:hypothetical protein